MILQEDIETLLRLQHEIKELQDRERWLRNKVAAEVSDKPEGATTAHLHGYKLTVTAKVNRSVDDAQLRAIWDALSDAEKDAVSWKPGLTLAKYRKLPEGTLLMKAVVAKPGMPSLKIEKEKT